MKKARFAAGVVVGAAIVGGAAAVKRLNYRGAPLPSDPSLYAAATKRTETGQLRVRFMGVSTLLFTDGDTSILTDGFFSRPGKAAVLSRRIGPNIGVIEDCLNKAEISSLAVVTAAHSHYDHAMDAPVVAQRTGAQLLGSESTLNIARGAELNETQFMKIVPHQPYAFGAFTLTFVESEHSPGGKFPGAITEPLQLPAKVGDYKMAECYSLIIEHNPIGGPSRKMLVHASAGYRAGMLDGYSADVAFLGTTLVTKQGKEFQREYWDETVLTVGAKRVIPIHWDDFTKPLSQPLVPMPAFIDDFGSTLDYLEAHKQAEGVDYVIPRTWLAFDPFEGLHPISSTTH